MKNLYTLTLFILLATLFTACGGANNRQSPYVIGKKPVERQGVYTLMQEQKKEDSAVLVANIEAQTQKDIALINKERDLEIKELEVKTKLTEIETKNALAIKEHNLSSMVQIQEFAFKNSTLTVISVGLMAFFLLVLYIFKKRREDRLKIHEDNLQKEVYLREKELQVKMAEKILDTIASGNLSEEREQRLLETLDNTTVPPPSIAYKK